jgi:hypothetical protein
MIANIMAPFTVHITTNSGTVLKTISHGIQTLGTVILADHIFMTLSNVLFYASYKEKQTCS